MSDTTKVFIVSGTTGQWSDSYSWNVAAYYTRKPAEAHAAAARQKADEIQDAIETAEAAEEGDYDFKRPENPYDPWMSMDYTGTWYGVEEVELRESFELEARDAQS